MKIVLDDGFRFNFGFWLTSGPNDRPDFRYRILNHNEAKDAFEQMVKLAEEMKIPLEIDEYAQLAYEDHKAGDKKFTRYHTAWAKAYQKMVEERNV